MTPIHACIAALGGDTQAQTAMGYRHLTGRGVPKLCHTANYYYQAAAAKTAALHERNHFTPSR